jgi:hypothetical protein
MSYYECFRIKKKPYQIIDSSDTNFIEDFYAIITAYIEK